MSENKEKGFEVFGVPGYTVRVAAGTMILVRPNGSTVYAPDPGTPEAAVAVVAEEDENCERLWREEQAALLLDDMTLFLKLQAARIVAQSKLRNAARGGAVGTAFQRGGRR